MKTNHLLWLAVLGIVLGVGPALATDPSRILDVEFKPGQVALPLDSLEHPVDSVIYLNPRLDTLLHSLGVISASFSCPECVMRLGIWAQPSPLGVPKPSYNNNFVLLFVSAEAREQGHSALSSDDACVEVNRPDTPDFFRGVEPSDPGFPMQWGLLNKNSQSQPTGIDIGCTTAWSYTTGSPSLLIGIVDGGTDETHVDFQVGGSSRIIADERIDPRPEFENHGTAVAGVIAAGANNGGLAGVDWDSRVFSKYAGGAGDSGPRTVELVDDGAAVINHSNGVPYYAGAYMRAMTYAYNNDVVSVAAMPNYPAADPQDTPSSHPGVIAVGSIRKNGSLSPSSGQGHQIDLLAPGGYSEDPDPWKIRLLLNEPQNGYTWASGTSYAAPHVTGVVALLRAGHPELFNDDVYQVLARTAWKDPSQTPGWDPAYGYGLVKADSAFKLLQLPNRIRHGQTAAGAMLTNSVSAKETKLLRLPGLSAGQYECKVYEMRVRVSFSKRYFSSVGNWPSGSHSLGFCECDTNHGAYYSEFVPGSVSEQGAVMRTYLYEVWDSTNNYYGFYPCEPEDARVAWTTFGEELLVSPQLGAAGPPEGIHLYWTDTLADEEQWVIDRWEGGLWQNGYSTLPAGNGVRSFDDINMAGSTQYFYRLHPTNVHQNPAPSNEREFRSAPNPPSCVSAYVIYCDQYAPDFPCDGCSQNQSACEGCEPSGPIQLEMLLGMPEGEFMQQEAGGGGGGDQGCIKTSKVVVEWEPPDNQAPNTVAAYQIVDLHGTYPDRYFGELPATQFCDTICIDSLQWVQLVVITKDIYPGNNWSNAFPTSGIYLSAGQVPCRGFDLEKRSVLMGDQAAIPYTFGLEGNAPNPFNAGTTFSFTLSRNEAWKIDIIDVLGQTVRTLRGDGAPGELAAPFDGRNEHGDELASGVYFWRVTTPSASGVRKMAIVK